MTQIPVAWRIAGGRRRYNTARRRAQTERRSLVRALLLTTEYPCSVFHGWISQIAREMGVHHSTIALDLAAIRPTLDLPDPCCEHHAWWREQEKSWERFVREEAAPFYELSTKLEI